jgi:uroporphyrinogen decarboxylase
MDSAERLKATYNFEPVDHLYRREFYIWTEALMRWQKEGMSVGKLSIKENAVLEPGEYPPELAELFGYDEPGDFPIGMLGWCEPAFIPKIEPEVIETTDKYDLVRDEAGRIVRFLKGKRHGFMPTYLKHAVANEKDWQEDILPLLDVDSSERWANIQQVIEDAKRSDAENKLISQRVIGGYMYLRSLVGPEEICYMFIDNPNLVHKMMQRWLELAEAVTSRIQEHVEYDELFFAEDICYNHGLLISPKMVREFLFPYYQQLIQNMGSRQKKKRLFIQVDSDGLVDNAIDLYREMGMDVMSPFEVAAGNDAVEIAKRYPDLVMTGGIDKRVLAEGKEAIDDYLQKLIPFMVKRGGFIPTCDHGVPDNVSFENYMYYRKRMHELDN